MLNVASVGCIRQYNGHFHYGRRLDQAALLGPKRACYLHFSSDQSLGECSAVILSTKKWKPIVLHAPDKALRLKKIWKRRNDNPCYSDICLSIFKRQTQDEWQGKRV